MAETIGSLVDKLAIANIRLWHLEDRRRNPGLSDAERLAAADGVSVVNGQRNDLIDEIDHLLTRWSAGDAVKPQPKMKLY